MYITEIYILCGMCKRGTIIPFFTGENSFLLKVAVYSTEESSSHHQIIQTIPFPQNSSSSHKVVTMKMHRAVEQSYIYVGTETEIYHFQAHSCFQYTTCYECVTVRDPYCAFDNSSQSCVAVSSVDDRGQLIQDIATGSTAMCNVEPMTTITYGGESSIPAKRVNASGSHYVVISTSIPISTGPISTGPISTGKWISRVCVCVCMCV